MKKKIICSLAVVLMLSLAIMPISGAINITNDREDIERIMDSGYEVKILSPASIAGVTFLFR